MSTSSLLFNRALLTTCRPILLSLSILITIQSGPVASSVPVVDDTCYDVNLWTRLDRGIPDCNVAVSFRMLCGTDPITNDLWAVYRNRCTLRLSNKHNISANEQEVSFTGGCLTILNCWLVFTNKSVCLYLTRSHTVSARQLKLKTLRLHRGTWTVVDTISVFYSQIQLSQILSSPALYEASDTNFDSAIFSVGNGRHLWEVQVMFNRASPEHSVHSLSRDCAILSVAVSTNGRRRLITCSNHLYATTHLWDPVVVTPPVLWGDTFDAGLTKTYINPDGRFGFIANNYRSEQGRAVKLCFISLATSDSRCSEMSNSSLTEGTFIEVNNVTLHFVALVGTNLIAFDVNAIFMTSSSVTHTIVSANVCPSRLCRVYYTDRLLYSWDTEGNTTTVLSPEGGYDTLVTAGGGLPLAERAVKMCGRKPTIAPSLTIPTTSITDSSTTMQLSSSSIQITSTSAVLSISQTLPYTVMPTETSINSSRDIISYSNLPTTSGESNRNSFITMVVFIIIGPVSGLVFCFAFTICHNKWTNVAKKEIPQDNGIANVAKKERSQDNGIATSKETVV